MADYGQAPGAGTGPKGHRARGQQHAFFAGFSRLHPRYRWQRHSDNNDSRSQSPPDARSALGVIGFDRFGVAGVLIYRFEEMELTLIIEGAFLSWIKILRGPAQRSD